MVRASAAMTVHFQHTGSLMEPEGGCRTPSGVDAEAGFPESTFVEKDELVQVFLQLLGGHPLKVPEV